jgi:hypothetical protein
MLKAGAIPKPVIFEGIGELQEEEPSGPTCGHRMIAAARS